MRKKFLHVVLIVVAMTVICCGSAFADDKPYGYPDDLPPVPDSVSGMFYIISGSRLYYVTAADVMYFEGTDLYGYSSSGSFGYGCFQYAEGSWVELTPLTVFEKRTLLSPISHLDYANFAVYSSSGDLVYSPPVPPPPPDPYENFWSDLNEVGTGVLGWAGNVASTITQEPVLLFTVGIFILGAAIGIFRRLLVRG